ncbi:MAG: hypothetical protein EBY17_08935 [Acidobacteriia bacterium]|nr:hypothetical protein [Terriglobia bacterium]
MASPEEEVVEVQAEAVAEAAAEQPGVADFPGSLDLPEQIREEVSAEDLLPDEATDDEKVDQISTRR